MTMSSFSDPRLVSDLAARISSLGVTSAELMEVCGTHTVSLARYGVKSLLPSGVRVVSGPGCPVCVTSDSDMDLAFQAARAEGTTLATFGDMMRVPVNGTCLLDLKAGGADVRIVYSPFDVLSLPMRGTTVFFGVGFETTSPGVAALLREADRRGVRDLCLISCFKLIPPALRAILSAGDTRIDGLILPGHVSTIIGTRPYEFLVDEFGVPGVIAGFEPVDLMIGIYVLLKMIKDNRAALVNAYTRSVRPEGNQEALKLLDEYFEPADAEWRGLGRIPKSSLVLRPEHSDYDATKRLQLERNQIAEPSGCRCADVIRGAALPTECPLFSKKCTPENPIGPCMVSSEGSCAAYYNYG